MHKKKFEKLQEAIDNLCWDSEELIDILEGFVNTPSELIDLSGCSEDHLISLCHTLRVD